MTAELTNSASSEFGGYYNSLEKFGGLGEISKIDELLADLKTSGVSFASNSQTMADNFSFQQSGMNAQINAEALIR